MSADVVESADDVIGAADNQDALIENLAGQITSRLRQFGDVPDEPPVLEEDQLLLALINSGIEKVARGQSVGLLRRVGHSVRVFSQTRQSGQRHLCPPLIAGGYCKRTSTGRSASSLAQTFVYNQVLCPPKPGALDRQKHGRFSPREYPPTSIR